QPYTAVYPYARNPELRDISARCMRSVNDQFVMLRDYLKTSGLADGAMIVLYSDHGSGWDRKYLRLSHGSNFDCIEAYRSILSIHAPGIPAGHEVAARVRMIDIYPTVLEWLELNPVSGIDGKSLLALAGGQNESEPRAVFAETGYTMDFRYNGDPFSEGQQIRNEVKRFKVDAGTGHIFINDGDYQDVIARKWYMLIDGNYRFVWQPWTRTETLSDLDGEPVLDPAIARAMQEKLERYRRQ
ncbi:MAG TPA: sulfatase-like hydrolase/transferase, partial [Candidatus Bathyarchaeia archaeon]|nr:sulfatase-like hydrolase/transferase [Candidatus Bathyarchaeia archaeon]